MRLHFRRNRLRFPILRVRINRGKPRSRTLSRRSLRRIILQTICSVISQPCHRRQQVSRHDLCFSIAALAIIIPCTASAPSHGSPAVRPIPLNAAFGSTSFDKKQNCSTVSYRQQTHSEPPSKRPRHAPAARTPCTVPPLVHFCNLAYTRWLSYFSSGFRSILGRLGDVIA